MRRAPIILAVAGLVFAFRATIAAWIIVGARHEWLVAKLPDDAYYYFEIGVRIADGQGATFDGINQTNGFHPLWQLIVAALATIFHGDALVRAALVTELVCLVAAIALIAMLVRRFFGVWAAAGVLIIGSTPSMLDLARDGMESGLSILTLVLLAVALARYLVRPGRAGAVLVGLACGAVVLARLDFATVVWVVPIAVAFPGRRWRRSVEVAAAAGLVTLPYFLWNLISFGHLLSVSGTRKLQMMDDVVVSTFGSRFSMSYASFVWEHARAILSRVDYLANPGPLAGTHLVTLMALVGFVGWIMRRFSNAARPRRDPGVAALAVVAGLVVAKGVIDVVVLPIWSTGWYSLPIQVLGSIALVVGAVKAWEGLLALVREPTTRRMAAVLGLVGLGVLVVASPHRWPNDSSRSVFRGNPWQIALDQTAVWLSSHPLKGRYGAYDAGLLGFELDPIPVVNLDGLTNDYSYGRLLADPAVPPIDRYRREGVDVLIGRFVVGDERLPACAVRVWATERKVPYRDDTTGALTEAPVGVYRLDRCSTP